MILWYIFAVFVLANAVDAFITNYAITEKGKREGNPLLTPIIGTKPSLGKLLTVKAVGVSFIGYILSTVPPPNLEGVTWVMVALTVGQIAVLFVNLRRMGSI